MQPSCQTEAKAKKEKGTAFACKLLCFLSMVLVQVIRAAQFSKLTESRL